MKINKIIMFNQVSGKLFRELAEDISLEFPEKSELYSGYNNLLNSKNKTEKLKIINFPQYERKSKLSRVFSWLKFTFFAFFKIIFVRKDTLILITTNPPLLIFLVWIVNKIRNLNYVVLVYDIYPDVMIKFSKIKENSIVAKFWRYLNQHAFEAALAVYTIGNVMSENLSKQFKVSKTKLKHIGVIPPWADTKKIKPINKSLNPLVKKLDQMNCITVLYSGNMGISHDIESILKSAKSLKKRSDIKFLFIGDGKKWKLAFDFVKKEKLNNAQVLPFQSEMMMPYSLALGDISIASLDKGAEGLMVPSKVCYYMASGSAVIGICEGKNDLVNSLAKGDFGFIVPPGEHKRLTAAILSLANNRKKLKNAKKNARQTCIAHFSRQVCMEKLKKSFKSIDLLS